MRYEKMKTVGTRIFYRVMDRNNWAAEFSYHTEDAGSTYERYFWLDDMRIADAYLNYGCIDSILRFVQYKCWKADFDEICLRVSGKNLLYLEWYRKYGFYAIAHERIPDGKGAYTYEYVMKFRLPATREEVYAHSIRRRR